MTGETMIEVTSISPNEYKSSVGFAITYGIHPSQFGEFLIGVTGAQSQQAICHLWFLDDNLDEALKIMQREWPGARLVLDQSQTKQLAETIFAKDQGKLRVLLKGTEFQVSVWKALLEVPRGSTVVYSEVAGIIGRPKAIRATAAAVAGNRIAYVIPCHRVVSKDGSSKYRWLARRKMEILDDERSDGGR
ncbi:uncharacterized protein LOC107036634 [Diachasma alloeum]|uniref:uncharacterized protein LOC107036634 n=1 Tax=Diachasma alloeum TaxID=454923 RepID=UPI00073837ED|nr:uncharacterized protein LOC107036634 [Diachasma alloeum]